MAENVMEQVVEDPEKETIVFQRKLTVSECVDVLQGIRRHYGTMNLWELIDERISPEDL